MAIPFLNFLAGGFQGYNQGRQQATVNDQQQQQLTEQQRAAQMMEQYRQQALQEQIRAAIAGEGLQQQQITNTNTLGQGNLNLDTKRFGFESGPKFDFLKDSTNADLAERIRAAMAGEKLQGIGLFNTIYQGRDRNPLNPDQFGAFAAGVGAQVAPGMQVPASIPYTPEQQNVNRLGTVQIANAKTQGGLMGAQAQQIRQNVVQNPLEFDFKKTEANRNYKLAQDTLAVQRAQMNANIGERNQTLDTALIRVINDAQTKYASMTADQLKAESSTLGKTEASIRSQIADYRKKADNYRLGMAQATDDAAKAAFDVSVKTNEAFAAEEQKKLAAILTKQEALNNRWSNVNLKALPDTTLAKQYLNRKK